MKAKTEKIKITVNITEVRDLEVSFPYYTRDNSLYCKFLSKDEAIRVCDYGFEKSITGSNCVPESWLVREPISESEFNAKFNEVMNVLISMNNEKTI